MQQPPPRKVKHTAVLRKTHSEQLAKLQQKHQHEAELLEDIRTFTKQRAAIEKDYAQALCKLAQQYLAKRHQFPQGPDNKEASKNEGPTHVTGDVTGLGDVTYYSYDEDNLSYTTSDDDTFDDDFTSRPDTPEEFNDDGKAGRTLNTVWKTVLEETDRVGRSRLQGADSYLQTVSEAVKPVKGHKQGAAKKVLEQTQTIHKEIAQTVNEMVRSHKVYHDEEHISHEARSKADEVDEKLKNKSTGLFTSMATLQKNSAKLNSRREACEVKSTGSRNEYLLNLAAANAHQIRYYSTDIPNLLQMLDGDMYDKVREAFIMFARTELECCGLTQECFTKIMSDAGLISRQYNLDCFLHDNLVFTDLVQYKFEAQDGDEETTVSLEHQAEEQVQKEARKWATKVAKEGNAIRQYNRQLQQLENDLNNASKNGNGEKSDKKTDEKDGEKTEKADPDTKLEDIRQNIRKAETAKMKAEARLDTLRAGGVDVDEWLRQANSEHTVEEDPAPRSSTSMSVKSDSSLDTSQRSRQESRTEEEPSAPPSAPNDSTYINYQEAEDDLDETFEPTTQTAPETGEKEEPADTSSTGYSSGRNYPMKCMAVYDFEASNSDEISLAEGEHLQIIGDGDGDGWVRALRDDGSNGLVPENYIQFLENGMTPDENEMNVDEDVPVERSQSTGERTSAYSATDYEVQKAMTPEETAKIPPVAPPSGDGPWARALYDYEATSEEELSFQEGQFIHVLRKDENGIDDGWWEGEVNGRRGVFPSLVVEEMTSAQGGGDPGVLSPVGLGPPAYTPPEPGPLPPQLEITHPTPSDENAPSEPGQSPDGTTGAADTSGGEGGATEACNAEEEEAPAATETEEMDQEVEKEGAVTDVAEAQDGEAESQADSGPVEESKPDEETEEAEEANVESNESEPSPPTVVAVDEDVVSPDDMEFKDDLPPPPPELEDAGPDELPEQEDGIPAPPPPEPAGTDESSEPPSEPVEAEVIVKPAEASSDMTLDSSSVSSPTNDSSLQKRKLYPTDPRVIQLLSMNDEGQFDNNAESFI